LGPVSVNRTFNAFDPDVIGLQLAAAVNGCTDIGLSDVLIVGAGIAGSLLALVLARRNLSVSVVDLHEHYPPDFRCEKLSVAQLDIFKDLGALQCVEAACANGSVKGRPLSAEGDFKGDLGFRYNALVNAVRRAWPPSVRFVSGRSTAIDVEPRRQRLAMADGQVLEGRVAVLATGPSPKLAATLSIERRKIRERHSVCIGFDISPPENSALPAEGLVHPGERAGDGMGFASIFPVNGLMRVNVFCFHDPRAPWIQGFRSDPLARLVEAMPRLQPVLSGTTVVGVVNIRATDLYAAEDYRRPGLVLIGDAFRSSCPSTGSGVLRALVDIQRLADVHLPRWLARPEIGVEAIDSFYRDPVKRAVDAKSMRASENVRSLAIDTRPRWLARRAALWLRREIRSLIAARRTVNLR
jgi:2-polyprenyl-6-methoxyphenol hydroxylase-like FAD-dependent oxidoreductase